MKITTAERLECMQDFVFDRHNYRARPFGQAYIDVVNELVTMICTRDLAKSITSEVIDELTRDNYHTVATACELVRKAVF